MTIAFTYYGPRLCSNFFILIFFHNAFRYRQLDAFSFPLTYVRHYFFHYVKRKFLPFMVNELCFNAFIFNLVSNIYFDFDLQNIQNILCT